jgi:hypothetical protein
MSMCWFISLKYLQEVWVVSPDKTLRRHLFDLVSTGGDSTSTNMRDYFDNFANVLRQICECTSTNMRMYFDNLSVRLGEVRLGYVRLGYVTLR